MKFYPFPSINHLDDLKLALEGREEIKLMDRGDYDVVDYLYVLPDTFPNIPDDPTSEEWRLAVLRRECRGILFNKDGSLLSRPLHKFFNMGEREETLPQAIDFSRPHHILNKEDGSMIRPFVDPQDRVRWNLDQGTAYMKRVFWGTMMGATDVAQHCEDFVEAANIDYEGFARMCLGAGWTPIFEWCSPKSRVVLKHDNPKLVLLTVRHNQTGVYKSYEEVSEWAERYGVPMVESFGRVDGPAAAFMDRVRDEKDIEGYVVQFDDGHCIKLKTAWYLRFHKAKENLVFEKDVIDLIMSGTLDDVLPVLMEQDKDHVLEYQRDLNDAMKVAARFLIGQVNMMKAKSGDDRAAYAKLVKANADIEGPLEGMAFRLFEPDEDQTQYTLIRDFVMKSTGSASKVEEMRKIVPVISW